MSEPPTPPQNQSKSYKIPDLLLGLRKRKWLVLAGISLITAIIIVLILQQNKVQAPDQTKQALTQSVNTSLGRIDGIDIQFDQKSGLATITQIEKTAHPEVSAVNVRVAYTLLQRLGSKVFSNPNIKAIQITEKIEVTPPKDSNEEFLPKEAKTEKASKTTELVTIAMTKTNFISINWDTYKGQPLHQLITEKAYIYAINPELKSSLNDGDLYLDLQ